MIPAKYLHTIPNSHTATRDAIKFTDNGPWREPPGSIATNCSVIHPTETNSERLWDIPNTNIANAYGHQSNYNHRTGNDDIAQLGRGTSRAEIRRGVSVGLLHQFLNGSDRRRVFRRTHISPDDQDLANTEDQPTRTIHLHTPVSRSASDTERLAASRTPSASLRNAK